MSVLTIRKDDSADTFELLANGHATGYRGMRQLRNRDGKSYTHWVLMRPTGREIAGSRSDNYFSAQRALKDTYERDTLRLTS